MPPPRTRVSSRPALRPPSVPNRDLPHFRRPCGRGQCRHLMGGATALLVLAWDAAPACARRHVHHPSDIGQRLSRARCLPGSTVATLALALLVVAIGNVRTLAASITPGLFSPGRPTARSAVRPNLRRFIVQPPRGPASLPPLACRFLASTKQQRRWPAWSRQLPLPQQQQPETFP